MPRSVVILLCLTFLVAIAVSNVLADISADSEGFAVYAEADDELSTVLTLTNSSDQDVPYRISISPQRWERGMALGPRRDRRGGPDDMEYIWLDNDEDDGPLFDWIDIVELEDAVEVQNVLDDSYHGMFDLGFAFPYYGNEYRSVGMHSNGFASLLMVDGVVFFWPGWEALPSAVGDPAPPPTMLGVNYQDMNPAVHGSIHFWTDDQMAVITWNEVSHFADLNGEGPYWTFQIVFFANGFMKFQYRNIGRYDNADFMIAWQNEDRDIGQTVLIDGDWDYLEEGRVIGIGTPEMWINWVSADPVVGSIPAEDELEVTLNFNFDNLEDGVEFAKLLINFPEHEFNRIEIPIVLSFQSPIGDLTGLVTDAANDNPIANAHVIIEPSGIARTSDEDGRFTINSLPIGNYQLFCDHLDYIPFEMGDIEVLEDREVNVAIELLHAECNLNLENIVISIAPDDETEIEFTAANDGNAELVYQTERRLLGDADAEPWELRTAIPISEITEDDRLQGVVFVNDHFYVAGSASRQKLMYVVSREGELVNTFEQFSTSTYGYNDLTWDGELIWGTGERRVYGFTPEGELTFDWDGPYAANNNLAWDSDRESLWVCGNTTDLVIYDREGNRGRSLSRKGLRIYGLAYWSDDPDGFNIYIYNNPSGDLQVVTKMNPVNGDTMAVGLLSPENGGRPAACQITNTFDIYSWVFITVANAGVEDRIDIWQLDSRRDWFIINPSEGFINPGESENFVLNLNASGLPPARFEGEIVFSHNGFGRQVVLPIILNVVEGRVHTSRRLDLTAGWNMVSLNIDPDEHDIPTIFQPLVEDDLLIMVKDGLGRFYRPEFGFNNIPGWRVQEGYQVRMADAASLEVEGTSMLSDDPIQLQRGWQLISYFPRLSVDVIVGLVNIADNLEIAKDVMGRFYLPAWGFNNMPPLREGQGYQLKMIEADELVINIQRVANSLRWDLKAIQPIKQVELTESNMSVLVLSDDIVGEIGVYAGDRLVGTGVITDGAAGIAVWGDDDLTGSELRLVQFKADKENPLQIENLFGEGIYRVDGLWVLRASNNPLPIEWGITGVYPNPFNMTSKALFRVKESSKVTATLYDINGREVLYVFNGRLEAGEHSLILDATSLSAGVYVLQVKANNASWQQKVAIVK